MSKARVLIVHSRVGGGHLSAARALAAELEATGRATPKLVDVYLECGRFPLTLFPTLYAWLARHQPLVWSLLFHGSNTRLDATRVLRPFLCEPLRHLIARERPHVVVSVLPVVNGLLAEAVRRSGARFEVVLTDWHSVHRFWVARGVDQYTVPTESARLDCVRFGASADAVQVVGIPVRPGFAEADAGPAERTRVLSGLGLDPVRTTVLMMVGAEGSPRALTMLRRLVQLELDAQIIVVCGRNESLRRRVETSPARLAVRPLGFVEHVAELMRSVDLLVTKAGGLTLAEAFCTGVPVVVYDVLPGQEAGNLEYVQRQGAVAYSANPRRVPLIVAQLVADPARRNALATAGRQLARPDAAQRIASALLERLG